MQPAKQNKAKTPEETLLYNLAVEAVLCKAAMEQKAKELKEIQKKLLPIMIKRAKASGQNSYAFSAGVGFVKYSKITSLEIAADDVTRLKNELGEHFAVFIEEKNTVIGKWPEIKNEIANADSKVAAVLRKFVSISPKDKFEVKINKLLKRKK